ncbi:hypothetical protein [Denitrobaculum tricleocarpae]|uniref:Uncharacterized protein n=1 Tax=Denitrobaculum tricleocarpae TaxID=2591009 RepID=A0A545U1G4_9PROT|nr:hypothetical protein [Denitrobaculum tricleocarpae]TQV83310.1 hypothetical protein FKG95_01545 [Denitrobaculum tricleocarpae]
MKPDRIEPHHADTPIPRLSDEETDSSIVVYQDPDNRTILQRLLAWRQQRYLCSQRPVREEAMMEVVEPEWRGHWAIAKYL